MSKPTPTHEQITALLTQTQEHLQNGDVGAASTCVEEALAQQLAAAPDDATGRAATLERELRFAMGLMALLFFTGIWGFWRGALYERAPRRGVSTGSPASAGKAPPSQRAPARRTKPRAIPPLPSGAAKISKQALMPRAVLAPSVLRRPKYRRKKKRARRSRSAFAPALLRTRPGSTKVPSRRLVQRPKRRLLRRKRRRFARRRFRFGDPASPSEVPRSWCGRRLWYGPYYPCLKRRRRRCVKRSKRRKYGCLRKRR